MLHLFLGENESDTRIEARKFAKDFASKNKEIVFDEPENVSSWDEVIFSKSLFGGGTLTFFDINQKDLAKDFLENKERFESSENFFVFSAKDSLVKADGLKSGKNFVLHNVKGGVKRELPNVFALSDAVGRRDKKQAWLLYRKLIEEGLSPEEIHGTIFWQIKSLAIAEVSNNYNEAKMKPFVFSKAKGFLKKFKEGEIKNWLSKLVLIYHKSHRGEYALENALEIFILGV